MAIYREFTKLQQEAYIDLYQLDLNPIGVGSIYYFVSDSNVGFSQAVVYQGSTYVALPIKVEGYESTQKAPFPRPTLTVSNNSGIVSSLMLLYDQLVGARLVRIRTLVKYLEGGSEAGGLALKPEIYFVETPLEENEQSCSFELINGLEMGSLTLPKRFIARRCVWRYRGVECGYTGDSMFTSDDVPTGDPTKDMCSHTLKGCKIRFGQYAQLPYGGFPSVDLY